MEVFCLTPALLLSLLALIGPNLTSRGLGCDLRAGLFTWTGVLAWAVVGDLPGSSKAFQTSLVGSKA